MSTIDATIPVPSAGNSFLDRDESRAHVEHAHTSASPFCMRLGHHRDRFFSAVCRDLIRLNLVEPTVYFEPLKPTQAFYVPRRRHGVFFLIPSIPATLGISCCH